ncbi:hypothetical protein CRU87_04250 [Aliarcobacter trophiarum LMG 25534]|uniref:Uncharacterized protein n=1 Tax=Aliarcobacter trophiarum LMG 25534 TaxID=1032241 RepID=A0AAD0VMC2_9BACT|nr:hypothetical protein [Aliarcobacter trophiarum]AXK48735.1 hypothetical protein ATR_0867 [Aliarcobacter trophiarum LMG 25534]RXJ92058.1 hypothetical protein CRU87_04250 [Aliarcobacter trophiarum LMG 25534]
MNKYCKWMKVKLIALGMISIFSIGASADGTYETVVFIDGNLENASLYQNVNYKRTSQKSIVLGKDYSKENINYIRPDSYKWEKEEYNSEVQDKLILPKTNRYSYLTNVKVKDKFKLERDEKSKSWLE